MNFTGMLKEGALQDKIILITGGGTGLGKSMGKYFMELGANLIITSRKQEVLDETAKEFSEYSGDILPIAGDVRNAKEVKQIIQASLEKFGKIDGLVNNAGIAFDGVLATMHATEISKILRINLEAAIVITKYACRSMLINSEGRVINISSIRIK